MLHKKKPHRCGKQRYGSNPQSTFDGGTIMSYHEITINGQQIKLIPLGECACGCGGKTTIAHRNRFEYGHIKGRPIKFISGHNGLKPNTKGYIKRKYQYEHILIAKKSLGKPLPPGAVIHHFNGKNRDNTNHNLIICQDQKYHMLLEQRTRAFKVCGHANWLKCKICKQYDDPSNLYINKGHIFHRLCSAQYARERRKYKNIMSQMA
jgi:hypothetical protein